MRWRCITRRTMTARARSRKRRRRRISEEETYKMRRKWKGQTREGKERERQTAREGIYSLFCLFLSSFGVLFDSLFSLISRGDFLLHFSFLFFSAFFLFVSLSVYISRNLSPTTFPLEVCSLLYHTTFISTVSPLSLPFPPFIP